MPNRLPEPRLLGLTASVARKLDAAPDDAQWKSEESAQELGDREISGAPRDPTLIIRYDQGNPIEEAE
jgi:hypothetical protein